MTEDELTGPILEITELEAGSTQAMTEAGVTTCLMIRATGNLSTTGEPATWNLAAPREGALHLLAALHGGAHLAFPDLVPSDAVAGFASDPRAGQSSLASNLRDTWEHTGRDLSRADLTALGCVAALFALVQAITQISSIPRVVYPFLAVAALLGGGVVMGTVWTLWPRRITERPDLPGSWLHALGFGTREALTTAYAEWSSAAIAAGQVMALSPVVLRKWMAVRVVLPLFCATVAVLLVGLLVGLLTT